MQPDRSERDRHELVQKAQGALIAVQLGQDDEAVAQFSPIEGETDEPVAQTRELMLLLFAECSAMVATLGDGGSAPVKVQVYDDTGEEVPIDQADPPVRTAVRTLLAEVHGNTDAAAEQVEIALASAAPDEVDSLVLQALRWTLRLSTACLERDLPVSGWIAEALTS